MTIPRVSDIVGIINKFAPFGNAEKWDNAGLQVGDPAAPVDKIMVALDAAPPAVEAAVKESCRLLLTHHPLIFAPPKKISVAEPLGRILALALKHDLTVVSMHTNYDVAEGGMNDLLAERLGVTSCTPLKAASPDELVKLAVFVPKGHEERLLDSLFPFSAFMGNYRDCSFRTPGTGTFRPVAGAHPYVGRVGEQEHVEESRIEVLLRRTDTAGAVKALLRAHPYEEPAFDLYPLLNEGKAGGLGRVGELPEAVSLEQFVARVKERLGLTGVRVVGDAGRRVKKVALCGGSGASLLRDAHRKGADVLVTGDVKYHEARDAEALGLALVDAGHFATELPMVQGVAAKLRQELAARRHEAEIVIFEGEREPFRYA